MADKNANTYVLNLNESLGNFFKRLLTFLIMNL